MEISSFFDLPPGVQRICHAICDPINFAPEIGDEVQHYGRNTNWWGHAQQRRTLAQRVQEFSRRNYLGLNSNCASFAHYMATGQMIQDVTRYENYFIPPERMYAYQGQALQVGDIVVSFWLRQNSELMYKSSSSIWSDALAKQKTLLEKQDILKEMGLRQSKVSPGPFDAVVLREFASSLTTNDYHFFVCAGHFSDSTGEIRPFFVSQNGHNRLRGGLILLPPFGNIRIGTFDDNVNPKQLPYVVFCSRQKT